MMPKIILMRKTLIWVAIIAAMLLIYLIAAKTLVLPWIGDKVAAIVVGAITLISGLFLRKKRST